MEKEEEDQRREAAIASTPCLRPNFNTKGVTKEQLSKFRELHKRRLQVKSKSKAKTKLKDETNKSQHDNPKVQDSGADNKIVDHKELSLSNHEGFDSRNSLVPDDLSMHSASNKRQKLYWGLDTKERWERKSNM